MDRTDLENELLKLPASDRAKLAEKLLESLESLTEEEHSRLWTNEALRRAEDLDKAPSKARPSDDVFRAARDRLP